MLKLRNISLVRRIYVWTLGLITRIAYWGNLADRPPQRNIEQRRIRRINSELECGPGAWKSSFLAAAETTTRNAPGSRLAFRLTDLTPFVAEGVETIVGDTLTRCFTADSPDPWNFLTRTAPVGPAKLTPYWTFLWLLGVWARYCVLFPFRLVFLFVGATTFIIGFSVTFVIPDGSPLQIRVRKWMLRFLASAVVASWSGYVRFHGNRPERRPDQIYVANHTSLIDVFVLVKDYNFSFIGQRHGGLAGLLEDLLHTAQDHVWFDRDEGRDRRSVQRLLKKHVADGDKEPMLVFPEGTCTNSDYCIMFKKGCFELGATVYPIAMKYKKRFGDPFWNSQTTSFPKHIVDIMTSWALVCDVYYLPPMTKRDDETSVQFSGRVRQAIVDCAGLTCVNWDGFLKRHRISPKFMKQRQKALSQIVQRRLSGDIPRAISSSLISESLRGGEQTRDEITGGIDMDTLSLHKLLPPRQQEDYYAEATSGNEREEREPDRAGLRRRASRIGREGDAPANGQTRMLRKARVAARDVTKWVFAFAWFAMAVFLTMRMMPASWIAAIAPAAWRDHWHAVIRS